jgi:hypothetical protein
MESIASCADDRVPCVAAGAAGARRGRGRVIEAPSAGVAGTHRSAQRGPVGVWGAFAACQALLAVLSYRDGRGSHAAAFVIGTGLGLAVAWLLWSQRTVIGSRGLRVKVGCRWRDLPWDEARSVDAPGRRHSVRVLSVTTTEAGAIDTHVPARLHQDLAASAAAEHRSSRPLRGDRESDDAPSRPRHTRGPA